MKTVYPPQKRFQYPLGRSLIESSIFTSAMTKLNLEKRAVSSYSIENIGCEDENKIWKKSILWGLRLELQTYSVESNIHLCRGPGDGIQNIYLLEMSFSGLGKKHHCVSSVVLMSACLRGNSESQVSGDGLCGFCITSFVRQWMASKWFYGSYEAANLLAGLLLVITCIGKWNPSREKGNMVGRSRVKAQNWCDNIFAWLPTEVIYTWFSSFGCIQTVCFT